MSKTTIKQNVFKFKKDWNIKNYNATFKSLDLDVKVFSIPSGPQSLYNNSNVSEDKEGNIVLTVSPFKDRKNKATLLGFTRIDPIYSEEAESFARVYTRSAFLEEFAK